MKKWNITLMAPSYAGQRLTIYNLELVKTKDYILEEESFEYFLRKYKLKNFYSKGYEVISASIIESDNSNNRIINKYNIDAYENFLYIKNSENKSVF